MGALRIGSLFICLFGLISRLEASDYFFTQSAHFHYDSSVSIFFNFNQYIRKNRFGNAQYLLQELPFKIKATIIKNVQASIAIPLIFGRSFTTGADLPLAIGDLELEARFGHDDSEYNYRQAYYFKYRASISPTTTKIASAQRFSQDVQEASYYPLASQFDEMTLGWHGTKNITPKTQFHLNLNYVYQLSTNESITNLIAFENISNADVETNARGGKLQDIRFSLFGLDTTLQNLFWTTSYNQPWSDKRNDHVNISMAIDTLIDADYYFGSKKVLLSLKPFLEVTFVLPFTSESFHHTRILITPGLLLKFTKHLRYLFGVGFLSSSITRFEFEAASFMSLRLVF